jgi:hypothetical protein
VSSIISFQGIIYHRRLEGIFAPLSASDADYLFNVRDEYLPITNVA